MNRILVGVLVTLVLSGCGRKAIAPVAARTAMTNAPVAPLPIRTVAIDSETVAESTNEFQQKRTWDVKIAWVPEEKIEAIGLKEFLSAGLVTNALSETELRQSALLGVAETYTNVILKTESAGVAGVCLDQTATNLVDAIEKQTGADVLTPWPIQTLGTKEGRAVVTANQTIVVEQNAAGSPVVTNLAFGHNFSLRVLSASGDSIVVEAATRAELFNGYGNEGNNAGARAGQPVPLLSLDVLGARAELKTNEALVLGGPVFSRVTKSVDRVMYLSDIPGLGRFFTKVETRTNFFRTVVVIRRIGQ